MEVTPYPAILGEATGSSSKRRMYWYMSTYMYCHFLCWQVFLHKISV